MIPKPNGHYILIKTSRQEEKDRREKMGILYLPSSQVFMTRNLQHGEVIAIGEKAHKHFPEVQVGHTLLVHHFVQAENEQSAKDEHLVHQDETYNYYVVSVYQVAGKPAETYGTFDGEKIIPNPSYVFLDYDKPVIENADIDNVEKQMQVSGSGILLFKEWKETREEKEERMAKIKFEVENLSKSGNTKSHIIKGIQEKEEQMNKISADINKKEFSAFRVAAFHPSLAESFNNQLTVGSTLYVLNMAAQTTIEFLGKEYRVVMSKVEYVGAMTR